MRVYLDPQVDPMLSEGHGLTSDYRFRCHAINRGKTNFAVKKVLINLLPTFTSLELRMFRCVDA